MLLDVAVVILPALFMVGGLALLAWWMRRGHVQTTAANPAVLFGLLLFAAFAMGVFLTYALLWVR